MNGLTVCHHVTYGHRYHTTTLSVDPSSPHNNNYVRAQAAERRRIIGVGVLLRQEITTAAARPPTTSPPPTKKQSTTPPNILILLTDDQDVVLGSFDHMPHAKTMLQDQGKTFVRGLFVHTPIQGGQQR